MKYFNIATVAAIAISTTVVPISAHAADSTPLTKEEVQKVIDDLSSQATIAEIVYARETYDRFLNTTTDSVHIFISNLEALEKSLAENIDAQIIKLNSNTSLEQVAAVREQYDALPFAISKLVRSEYLLTNVEREIAQLHDVAKKRALAVTALISKLDENSWEDTIAEARSAYNQLDDLGRSYVTNLDYLVSVEESFTLQQKLAEAQKEALAVDLLISKLVTSSSQLEIEEVVVRYDELSLLAQSYVTRTGKFHLFASYYDRLKEAQINQLKRQAVAVEELISELSYKSTSDQLANVRAKYTALDALAKPYVSNYGLLEHYEAYVYEQITIENAAKLSAAAFDKLVTSLKRSATKEELRTAYAQYNSLSKEAKQYVELYDKLGRIEKLQAGISTSYEYLLAAMSDNEFLAKPVPIYIADAKQQAENVTTLQETYDGYEGMINLSSAKKLTNSELIFTNDENLKVTIPLTAIKSLKGNELSVAFSLDVNAFHFTIMVDDEEVTLAQTVEIQMPMLAIGASANLVVKEDQDGIEKVANYIARAPYFIIRTNASHYYTASNEKKVYADIGKDQHKQFIEVLAQRHIVSGDDEQNYYPKQNITRADFAVMLARAANLPEVSTAKTFEDIKGKEYEQQVLALYKAGVIKGVSATKFAPDAPLTRTQAALMITRLLNYLQMDTEHMMNTQLMPFTDVKKVSAEGRNAIALMYMLGIFSGREDGTFNPNGNLTRSHMAKVLYNTMQTAQLL